MIQPYYPRAHEGEHLRLGIRLARLGRFAKASDLDRSSRLVPYCRGNDAMKLTQCRCCTCKPRECRPVDPPSVLRLLRWYGPRRPLQILTNATNPGERVWGRGSSDDKSGLIGIMYVKSIPTSAVSQRLILGTRTTVENLIKTGFKPTRSIFLAFGFDEEASGLHVSSFVIRRVHYNSVSHIVTGRSFYWQISSRKLR